MLGELGGPFEVEKTKTTRKNNSIQLIYIYIYIEIERFCELSYIYIYNIIDNIMHVCMWFVGLVRLSWLPWDDGSVALHPSFAVSVVGAFLPLALSYCVVWFH